MAPVSEFGEPQYAYWMIRALADFCRLQAFLAVVQGANVQIPAALQNFVQSYMRLSDIVADIDRTVEDLQIAAASIYCDAPDLAPVEGENRLFAGIRKIASANIGNAVTPYSDDAVDQAAADALAYVKSDEGKAEIKALSHDLARLTTMVKPFCETLNTHLRPAGNTTLDPTAAAFSRQKSASALIIQYAYCGSPNSLIGAINS